MEIDGDWFNHAGATYLRNAYLKFLEGDGNWNHEFMSLIRDLAAVGDLRRVMQVTQKALQETHPTFYQSYLVADIIHAIYTSNHIDEYDNVIQLLIETPGVEWREMLSDLKKGLERYGRFQPNRFEQLSQSFQRALRRARNNYVQSLAQPYLSLRSTMPAITPREFTKKILYRAEYDHLCRDLKSGAIPSFKLVKLMDLMGLQYDGAADKSQVCRQVLEAVQRMGIAPSSEMTRMEQDIADTLRRQELEELDRRERKRLKRVEK